MKVHQVLVPQHGTKDEYLVEFKYEYSNPAMPEEEALERLDAVLRVFCAQQSFYWPVNTAHSQIRNVIVSGQNQDSRYRTPDGFLGTLYVTRIELANPKTAAKKSKYTIEDQLRDLANLAERERLAVEKYAQEIEKRPGFEDEIRQRFFEERLKIDSRPLSD